MINALGYAISVKTGNKSKSYKNAKKGCIKKKKNWLFTFISESVVEPEVRQVDSSSSILLSQDCFGYSRFFVFPYKL